METDRVIIVLHTEHNLGMGLNEIKYSSEIKYICIVFMFYQFFWLFCFYRLHSYIVIQINY